MGRRLRASRRGDGRERQTTSVASRIAGELARVAASGQAPFGVRGRRAVEVPQREAQEGEESLQEGNRMRAMTVASRSKPLKNRWLDIRESDCGGRVGHQVQEGKVGLVTVRPSRGGNPWRVSRTPGMLCGETRTGMDCGANRRGRENGEGGTQRQATPRLEPVRRPESGRSHPHALKGRKKLRRGARNHRSPPNGRWFGERGVGNRFGREAFGLSESAIPASERGP